MRTVVGMYDQFEEAQNAVQALNEAGFDRNMINLIARDVTGEYSRELDRNSNESASGTATGAGIGAVLGGLGGLLVGLGALAIPGIGPVIAAGPILTTLAGAGVGAVAGGLIGALVDMGIPEEHAQFYAEGVRRGGSLVVIRTTDDQAEKARQVLNRYHPVDIEERSQAWQEKPQRGVGENVTSTPVSNFNRGTVPVTGSSSEHEDVRDTGDFDRKEDKDLNPDWNPYGRQTWDRKPLDPDEEHHTSPTNETDTGWQPMGMAGAGSGTDMPEHQSHGTNIPVTGGAERRRDDNLSGEFSSGDWNSTDDDLPTDRINPNPNIPVTGGYREPQGMGISSPDLEEWNSFDREFMDDYSQRYGSRGMNYEDMRPAYRYGYDLAYNRQYMDYDWNRLEPYARQDWERGGFSGAWEDVKDAVRNAWDKVKNK